MLPSLDDALALRQPPGRQSEQVAAGPVGPVMAEWLDSHWTA